MTFQCSSANDQDSRRAGCYRSQLAEIMKHGILLAIAVAAVSAQTPTETAVGPRVEPAEAAALRARGLELGYNLDHADAIEAFRQAIGADPHRAAAHRLLAGHYLDHVALRAGRYHRRRFPRPGARYPPSIRAGPGRCSKIFHDSLGQAIRIAEQQLRDHPADAGRPLSGRRRVRVPGLVHRDRRGSLAGQSSDPRVAHTASTSAR